MKTIISKSVKETIRFGKDIAKNLKGGEVLALIGDLGGGKTHFSKAVIKYFGIKEGVQSPTFTLINEYHINKRNIKTIYHMDMYRLKNEKEAQNLGICEIFEDQSGICIIEWADKIKNLLPKKTRFIEFDFIDENTRRIILK